MNHFQTLLLLSTNVYHRNTSWQLYIAQSLIPPNSSTNFLGWTALKITSSLHRNSIVQRHHSHVHALSLDIPPVLLVFTDLYSDVWRLATDSVSFDSKHWSCSWRGISEGLWTDDGVGRGDIEGFTCEERNGGEEEDFRLRMGNVTVESLSRAESVVLSFGITCWGSFTESSKRRMLTLRNGCQ